VNADAAVIRPLLDSDKGVVLTAALNPSYSELDSYAMAASSIDGAIRTAVAAGANINHLAILDNFCWCSSTEPVRLNQLKNAVKACYDYSISYGTPLISGKDSMFNDFKGFDEKGNPIKISIPPTLLVSAIGVMKDVHNAVSLDFKFDGDLIYVLGDTKNELAGSEYFSMLAEHAAKTGKNKGVKETYSNTAVPHVDAMKNKRLYVKFASCTAKNLISSSISVGRGGLATALAKSAIGGKLGATIDLKPVSKQTASDDFTLFSESQGRILVSIDPNNKKAFENEMKGVNMAFVGKVTAKPVVVINGRAGKEIVRMKTTDALTAYKSTLKNY
jgi:phosphoribosylformylglycinamidine synthase